MIFDVAETMTDARSGPVAFHSIQSAGEITIWRLMVRPFVILAIWMFPVAQWREEASLAKENRNEINLPP